MRTVISALLLLACVGSAHAAAQPNQPAIRRFALVASSGDGGPDRVRLRYARSDAEAIVKVLRELGGVNPADTVVLLDANRTTIEQSVGSLSAMLAAAKQSRSRLELFVYYSGHSDEEGLLLGREKLGYGELRSMLDGLPADVRIAILDSCASGAMTRAKGGAQRPPFLMDASATIKGHAFLTSSSADEVSQESDSIAASFFTHALVSGLRGAADFNRDDRVTLNEAYQFAFNETLSRTEKTSGGAQHAGYDIQLSGAGDLVLTDLRQISSALILAESLRGHVFIRDDAGTLVVELTKFAGRPVELGLEPGRYRVTLERDRLLYVAQVVLTEGKQATLSERNFTFVEAERTAMRGATESADAVTATAAWAVTAPRHYKIVPLSSSLWPRVSTEGVEGDDEINYFSFNEIGGHAAILKGVELGFGLNSRSEEVDGVQFSFGGNFAGMGWWAKPHYRGEVNGVQLAFGTNLARGPVTGLQTSFGYNGAFQEMRGAQVSFGANSARVFRGVQATFGVNAAGFGDQRLGGQLSFGANYADGNLSGVQLTYGANYVESTMKGTQLAFGGNYAEEVRGFQVAFGGNYAGAVRGVQVAQGFNVSKDMDGVQAGPFANVVLGRARGLQLGFVNYNEDITGAAIGMVSISKRQPLRWRTWTDDVNALSTGVKFKGSPYVYNLIYVGGQYAGGQPLTGANRWSLGWSLGAEKEFGRHFFVDLDGSLASVQFADDFRWKRGLAQARLTAGWRISDRFALYAGPTYNLYQTELKGKEAGEEVTYLPDAERTGTSWRVRRWPGFIVGFEI